MAWGPPVFWLLYLTHLISSATPSPLSPQPHKMTHRTPHTIYYHALVTLYMLFPPQRMPLPTCPRMQFFFHLSALKAHFTCHLHCDAFFLMLSQVVHTSPSYWSIFRPLLESPCYSSLCPSLSWSVVGILWQFRT